MTDAKSFSSDELAEIFKAHHNWLKGNNGKRANLCNTNLQGITLENIDLQMANLSDANLKGVSFIDVNLEGANLTEVNLSEACLVKVNLTGAKIKQASLKNSLLTDVNFSWANLEQANLENTDLTNANFEHANLQGATLIDSILQGTNFQNAILIGARYSPDQFHPAKSVPAYVFSLAQLQSQLTLQDVLIDQLKSQLRTAVNEEERLTLQDQLKILETTKKEQEKTIYQLEEENKELQQKLSDRISDAITALRTSLTNTEQQIKKNNRASSIVRWTAFGLTLAALAVLIAFSWFIFFCPNSSLFHHLNELIKSMGAPAIIFYTFPVVILFLGATLLFRHDQKIMTELRHYSDIKNQIDLCTGILEAAQHTAASLKDQGRAETYVEETFTLIRNQLLKQNIHTSKTQPDKNDDPNMVTSLTELVKALGSLGSKSG